MAVIEPSSGHQRLGAPTARKLTRQVPVFFELLASQYDEAARSLEADKDRLVDRIEDRQSYNDLLSRGEDIEAAHANWLEARASLEHLDQIAARFQEQEVRRQEPLAEIKAAEAALLQEQQGLEDKQVEIQAEGAQLPSLEKEISILDGKLKDIEHRLARRNLLQSELQNAQKDQAQAHAENPRLKADMDQLKERIDQLAAAEGGSRRVNANSEQHVGVD